MSSLIATIGTFDGVHSGHRHILDQLTGKAGELGYIPAVVTFTNHPLHVINPDKSPALLSSPEEKRKLLMEAGANVVIMQPFTDDIRRMTARRFMEELRHRYDVMALLLGFNNKFGNDPSLRFDDYRRLGKELGMEVHMATEKSHDNLPVSSTVIRNHLINHRLAEANRLLGYNYTLSGKVVHGKQIGRTLGFPTANIQPDSPFKMIPPDGVYACMATLENGRAYPAMVNIGLRPTIGDAQPATTIEAHIIGVNAKLYGAAITLEFISFLRHEIKFSSLEQLKAQLQADKIRTINILGFKQ